MRFKSYWSDTAPAFSGGVAGEVSGHFDVAVVGGGFTGLSAARHLAMAGASVVVLEADRVGSGASGRNGGHLNNGLAHSFLSAKAAFGTERAIALYRAFDDAVDTVERIVAEEGIDCGFRRSDKLKLASKPAHFVEIARNFKAINREVDSETALLDVEDLSSEIGSREFHGAMLSRKSAMMHMGRFVTGLADAAVRRGAVVFENTRVTARLKKKGRHELSIGHGGTVTASNVLVATGSYTSGPFDWFRRRIVPMGSFVVATRPLTREEIAATVPGSRTFVTSLNIGNYFRLSSDCRLIFGGRARFSATSDQTSDEISGAILKASLAKIFPQLAEAAIDYCWGGLVDMTQDRYPRAGFHDGVFFAMGYSGHGTQMSTHMGVVMADIMLGNADRNPLSGFDWSAIPGYLGKPWFLPVVGMYYTMLDRYR